MARNKYLQLGTRKGLVTYELGARGWQFRDIQFLGVPVSLTFVDRRNNTWWASLDHGHWGMKLHRSFDEGRTWEEVEAPKYPEGLEVKPGVPAATRYIWAFAGGGADKPEVLYIGTEPGGLFKSSDGGNSFQLMESLWNHPSRAKSWWGGGRDEAGIHSIIVDPRDSDHIYVGVSVAGVYETKDGGQSWHGRNKGLRADYLPDPDSEQSQDPHLLVSCPASPDHMWQQHHCGIFRSVDGAQSWLDVSEKEGPANFGFAIAVGRDNPGRAWVVPGISDVLRVSVDEALCVCRTDDGGKSWRAFRKGLPQQHCYDIVYRHSLDVMENWVAFGTTTGNLFISDDEGESWQCLNNYLPLIYSVNFVD